MLSVSRTPADAQEKVESLDDELEVPDVSFDQNFASFLFAHSTIVFDNLLSLLLQDLPDLEEVDIEDIQLQESEQQEVSSKLRIGMTVLPVTFLYCSTFLEAIQTHDSGR